MSTSHRRKASLDTTPVPTPTPRPILKTRTTAIVSSASLLGASRKVERKVTPQFRDMATSFLQYCAMCEKQITTPCNSILYCSDACRRKDAGKPLTAANLSSMSPTMTITPPDSPTRPILPVRAPTGTYTDSPIDRIPVVIHDHKSDLDPTEWKPKLKSRGDSEAFRYLSRFHRSTMPDGTAIAPASMPSLENTPATSTASSLGTSLDYFSSSGGGGHGHAYDFTTRPLPTRHNRWYSVSGATPKGTDLVTPHIVPAIMVHDGLDEDGRENLWERKIIRKGATSPSGLGAMFEGTGAI